MVQSPRLGSYWPSVRPDLRETDGQSLLRLTPAGRTGCRFSPEHGCSPRQLPAKR